MKKPEMLEESAVRDLVMTVTRAIPETNVEALSALQTLYEAYEAQRSK